MYIIGWIVLCILCGKAANGKGKSFWNYFFLSLLLSPLIGFIAVLIAKEDIETVEVKAVASGDSKKCPFCAELIKSEAKICKYCSSDLVGNKFDTGSEVCPKCNEPRTSKAFKICLKCKYRFNN
tara:strand:+ start:78 stop:449 length:372 start_codon:yes stop_codon:yes gene_type:complete